MRCAIVIILVLFCFLINSAPASASTWPTEVHGYGLTTESAKQNAKTAAIAAVAEYLRNLEPALAEWQPDEKYLTEQLLEDFGAPGEDVSIDGSKTGKVWIVHLKQPKQAEFVRLNRQALQSRQDRERQETSRNRLGLAGWICAGIVILLLGGSFIRR